MSQYSYSPDEFDTDEDSVAPVGVHRAQLPAWRSWLPLLLVIVIAPMLAWGAVTLLSDSVDSKTSAKATSAAQEPEETQAPGPAPTTKVGQVAPGTGSAEPSSGSSKGSGPTDFTLGVTVHNGTTVSGLAGRTGDRLRNAGYTSVTVSQGIYSATDPQTTTVFYGSDTNLPSAQAVAETLGIQNVVKSTDATGSNPLVVVLRSDFQE